MGAAVIVKKAVYLVAVSALLVIFCSPGLAGENRSEPIELPGLLLAQQTQEESADQHTETPVDEVRDQEKKDEDEDEFDDEDEYDDEGPEEVLISDPLIGMNRGLYHFNDKMYFWVLKPVSRGYGFIIPEELRLAVRNMFYNVRFPVRFINCLLQGKVRKSWYTFGEFFINTTVGFLGMQNVAANYPELQPSKEDLGQTFAVWGFGNGAFIMLPFFGPSSVRDGLGRLGDTFFDPLWWYFDDIWVSLAIRAFETVNETSTRIGEYEALKEAAIDPYIMLRNAWVQNRNKLIAE